MAGETVLVDLNWTYGVNVNGRTVYFGPGRVPVPRDIAQRRGWWTAPADESASAVEAAAGEVRARTVLATDVAAAAGAPYLADVLGIAGFVTAVSIRDASQKELTAVAGIGKVTAQKLQDAATQLLAGESA